ncbi:Protein ASP-8 [Aphelenchoides avenae]|nr:Protein ASP-8 [Aphelenchus avenae]
MTVTFRIAIGPFPIYDYFAVVEISAESPVLVLPTVYFRLFVKVFGAEYDFELDTYTVDCAKAKSLPEIHFTVGDPSHPQFDYTVPPAQFVVRMETKQKSKCALLIVESDSSWTLGSQFLPKRCVNLDFERSLISFADAVTV